MRRDWFLYNSSIRECNTDLYISDSRCTARRFSAPYKSLHLPAQGEISGDAAAAHARIHASTVEDTASDCHRYHGSEEVRAARRGEEERT